MSYSCHPECPWCNGIKATAKHVALFVAFLETRRKKDHLRVGGALARLHRMKNREV